MISLGTHQPGALVEILQASKDILKFAFRTNTAWWTLSQCHWNLLLLGILWFLCGCAMTICQYTKFTLVVLLSMLAIYYLSIPIRKIVWKRRRRKKEGVCLCICTCIVVVNILLYSVQHEGLTAPCAAAFELSQPTRLRTKLDLTKNKE